MATLLLVVIYLSFISLGVPDSLLGTAWPVLYRELGVPLASQSAVSILCSLATMTSSMNSARIISHLGTGKVTAFSTLLCKKSKKIQIVYAIDTIGILRAVELEQTDHRC